MVALGVVGKPTHYDVGMPSRALIDLTDDELKEALRKQAEHVIYSYTDLLHELDRRATLRLARSALILSALAIVVAIVALVVIFVRT